MRPGSTWNPEGYATPNIPMRPKGTDNSHLLGSYYVADIALSPLHT